MRAMTIFGLAAVGLLAAQSVSAEPRALSGFDRVYVEDNIAVEVHMGAAFAVDVSGPEADRVLTRIEGDRLKIWERNRPWFGPDRRVNARVSITMPAITGLAAARGASLQAEGIQAQDIALAAAMGADLRVSGACRAVEASAAMGAMLRAGDLHCATADVSGAMGAGVWVYASENFDASAAMGSAINVAGGGHGDSSAAMGGTINVADGGKVDHRAASLGGEITQN